MCDCGRSNPAALRPKTLNTWFARFLSRFRQTERTEETGTHLKRCLELATDDEVITTMRERGTWSTHSKRRSTTLGDFQFPKLKSQIERLATEAWHSQDSLRSQFLLNPSAFSAASPERVIEAILNHVRIVCPGLSVPLRVPRVETGSLIDAGGMFKTTDGWVSIKIANHLFFDQRAVGAILAHEVCHYVLGNSGIRESNVDENERLTDAFMFVSGLGSLFMDGYTRRTTNTEYRSGHRLGYLTDAEYDFAARYVETLRSDNSLGLLTNADHLKRKLIARIADKQACERLISNARRLYPNRSETEIYDLVLTQYERDRR